MQIERVTNTIRELSLLSIVFHFYQILFFIKYIFIKYVVAGFKAAEFSTLGNIKTM